MTARQQEARMSEAFDYRKVPDTGLSGLSHIPGERGMPILGKTPALFNDFYGTLERHYQKYGKISKIGIGFQIGLMPIGPDYAQEILVDKERNYSNQMGYSATISDWFGGSILSRDFDEHRFHRRIFQSAFKSDAMEGYSKGINEIIASYLNAIEGKQEITFMPFIKAILMSIGARIFFGIEELGELNTKRFERSFLAITEKGMRSLIKKNIPGFNYYYGMKGKRFVVNYLVSLINERRNGSGQDFMSHIVKEKLDDGSHFSDQDIIDHLSFLFFAAFDTTSTGLSHLVMHIAENQQLQGMLRQKSFSIGSEVVTFKELGRLPDIEMAFSESLRLYPPVAIIMRRTICECVFDNVRIPANTILFLIPGMNHRMPEYWTNPLSFDPQRFSPERQEHKKHPYQFTPFGGGAHKCLGMNFAMMNAKLFMHQLLLRYRVKLKPGYRPGSRILPTPTPFDDLPVILEKY
jgi:cytochrome P450